MRRMFPHLKQRIPGLETLSSFWGKNGRKASITGKGRSRMNEIENSSNDRNLMDWTPMNIPGSKILFLVPEGKETTRSDPRESLERVKSDTQMKGGMGGITLGNELLFFVGLSKYPPPHL
ncbi:hypothetical protein Tco_0448405 [Tanacetum coccineum]